MLGMAMSADPMNLQACALLEMVLQGQPAGILSLHKNVIAQAPEAQRPELSFRFGVRWATRLQDPETGTQLLEEAFLADPSLEPAPAVLAGAARRQGQLGASGAAGRDRDRQRHGPGRGGIRARGGRNGGLAEAGQHHARPSVLRAPCGACPRPSKRPRLREADRREAGAGSNLSGGCAQGPQRAACSGGGTCPCTRGGAHSRSSRASDFGTHTSRIPAGRRHRRRGVWSGVRGDRTQDR